MTKIALRVLIAFHLLTPTLKADNGKKNVMTRIEITVGETVVRGYLLDSPAARDFAKMLPLKLSLDYYAEIEKIATLPRKLTTDGEPKGYEPSAGDITFYAPWGNLAIFTGKFQYSNGLVHLGVIETHLDALKTAGLLQVEIRKAKERSE